MLRSLFLQEVKIPGGMIQLDVRSRYRRTKSADDFLSAQASGEAADKTFLLSASAL